MATRRGGVARRLARGLKPAVDTVAGWSTVVALRAVRLIPPDRISTFAGRILRLIGPWRSEHQVGRANLEAAFPEKSPAEIEKILRSVWENLGKVAAEYAHLDRLWDYDFERGGGGRIEVSDEVLQRFFRLGNEARPALVFGAHIGNWELPPVAAKARGLEIANLYRRPNLGKVADAIARIRAVNMGTLIPADFDAAFRLAAALERGIHVGILVDQHFSRGVDVTFFGRRCKANPMIARLARRLESPIHGTRVIRLPGNRFRIDLTEAIAPARDSDGQIDVARTMQTITAVVEDWVREYPEQWLWLHRRWR